jgi:hypothetical protein
MSRSYTTNGSQQNHKEMKDFEENETFTKTHEMQQKQCLRGKFISTNACTKKE